MTNGSDWVVFQAIVEREQNIQIGYLRPQYHSAAVVFRSSRVGLLNTETKLRMPLPHERRAILSSLPLEVSVSQQRYILHKVIS